MGLIGTAVKLNDDEQKIIKEFLIKLKENKKLNGIKQPWLGTSSKNTEAYDEAIHLQGFGAEFAFCKLFGIEPDLSIGNRNAFNDNGDAKMPNSHHVVDVKSTPYTNGKLIVEYNKINSTKVTCFALMTGIFPKYIYRGLFPKDKLFKTERLKHDLGYFPGFVAYQYELMEFEDLK